MSKKKGPILRGVQWPEQTVRVSRKSYLVPKEGQKRKEGVCSNFCAGASQLMWELCSNSFMGVF